MKLHVTLFLISDFLFDFYVKKSRKGKHEIHEQHDKNLVELIFKQCIFQDTFLPE